MTAIELFDMTATELADIVAGSNKDSFASHVRGAAYAPADWPAVDAAGSWVAWGWIELDQNPCQADLESYLRGFEATADDYHSLLSLAAAAGEKDAGEQRRFADCAVRAAREVWLDHWRELANERDDDASIDEAIETGDL